MIADCLVELLQFANLNNMNPKLAQVFQQSLPGLILIAVGNVSQTVLFCL